MRWLPANKRRVSPRDIIVLGGSAGSISAVGDLVRAIPGDIPAAMFVAVHVAPDSRGLLAEILDRIGTLPAAMARDGEEVASGRIVVAPPDRHLILESGRVRLRGGPRVNRFRPSVDVLFRSAAASYGPRVAAVVLSGMLDDGSHGLHHVKQRGGVAIVQDTTEAAFTGMPLSAIDRVAVDHVLPVAQIAALLADLAHARGKAVKARKLMAPGMNRRKRRTHDDEGDGRWLSGGERTLYGCPDCGGALLEVDDGLLRFRCRIGHEYSAESLLASQEDRLEDALWTAVRSLEEGAATRQRMAARVAARGATAIAAEYEQRASSALEHAATLRAMLERGLERASVLSTAAPPRRRLSRAGTQARARTRRR